MLIPYKIHCSCGHDIEFGIDANLFIADQIAKYFMEQGCCPDCRHKQLTTQEQETNTI